MDAERGAKELDEFEAKLIDKNETIKEIITSTNQLYKSITLGGKNIRIKQYMPKAVRRKTVKIGRELEGGERDIEDIENEIYPIVAAMCVDEPFNKAAAWEKIDEETGCIQDVLLRIVSEVNKTDTDIKSFR